MLAGLDNRAQERALVPLGGQIAMAQDTGDVPRYAVQVVLTSLRANSRRNGQPSNLGCDLGVGPARVPLAVVTATGPGIEIGVVTGSMLRDLSMP